MTNSRRKGPKVGATGKTKRPVPKGSRTTLPPHLKRLDDIEKGIIKLPPLEELARRLRRIDRLRADHGDALLKWADKGMTGGNSRDTAVDDAHRRIFEAIDDARQLVDEVGPELQQVCVRPEQKQAEIHTLLNRIKEMMLSRTGRGPRYEYVKDTLDGMIDWLDSRKLPRGFGLTGAERRALHSYEWAVSQNPNISTDSAAHEYIELHSCPDYEDVDLPQITTWKKALSRARRKIGDQKHTVRRGRATGRSIVSQTEI